MRWEQSPFKLRPEVNGRILTVHHTVEEAENIVRIPQRAAAFDDSSKILVTIDNKSIITVFNFATSQYHVLDEYIPKATFAQAIPPRKGKIGEFFVGTKSGVVYHLDTRK